jgi:DNA-binding NarL/FixJ family response regulator
MSAPLIRVVLADDHPVFLAGLRSLVEAVNDIEVIGCATNGAEALTMILERTPDIAVLDLSMPQLDGIGVVRRLRAQRSACKVIALTAHEGTAYLRQLLELGMGGYVLKRSAATEIPRAIRAVHGGGVYFDPDIAAQLLGSVSARPQPSPFAAVAELSEREAEVLRLTALGHSNKSIAAELNLGVKTVETYKARAMGKLGFRSRVDIVRYASDKGWLSEA